MAGLSRLIKRTPRPAEESLGRLLAVTTVAQLREAVSALERRSRTLGVGIVGLIALGFGDLSSTIAGDAPRWLTATFITLTSLCGFLVSWAWIECHLAERLIRAAEAKDFTVRVASLTSLVGNVHVRRAKEKYDLGRTLLGNWLVLGLLLAGATFLAATWWWAASSGRA